MDDEERKKLFEMHGTIQRLDQKTDNILQTQGELKAEVNNLETDVDQVRKKTQRNKKKIYTIYALAGVTATVAGIVAAALPYFY